jgi:hypothetical protein
MKTAKKLNNKVIQIDENENHKFLPITQQVLDELDAEGVIVEDNSFDEVEYQVD